MSGFRHGSENHAAEQRRLLTDCGGTVDLKTSPVQMKAAAMLPEPEPELA
jgi:hypothetical protein